jgi:hypothetical protein
LKSLVKAFGDTPENAESAGRVGLAGSLFSVLGSVVELLQLRRETGAAERAVSLQG